MSVFEEIESEVRYYCRSFPKVFDKAEKCNLYDEKGEKYLDFFAGAGALNYGHNNPKIMGKVEEYMKEKGIVHALDMSTAAKEQFLTKFNETILKPRDMDYKVMFCGSTGTNSVEAALKLARKIKKRKTIFAFMGAFHGMSLGGLSVTSGRSSRESAGTSLNDVVFMPFPYGFNKKFDTIKYIENVLEDDHSGISMPAAIILETVQAEGGVVVAEIEWLRRLRALCDKYGILLICDEIQVGCGRTGTFFSFERAGIKPDMITVSKSIGGCGLPMSLLLMKRELDIWNPGEHNGTFRGNQLAFVAAHEALSYYDSDDLLNHVKQMEQIMNQFIEDEILPLSDQIEHRGIGLIHGIDLSKVTKETILSKDVSEKCFEKKLIIECCGREDKVLKILPPLVITEEELLEGLHIIKESLIECLNQLVTTRRNFVIGMRRDGITEKEI